MKRVIPLLLLSVPGIASAQSLANPQPTMNMPNYTTSPVETFAVASGETPTMKRQKLVQALALREEAARLLAADGGTFTPEHRAYIERKVRRILR
jgi:hypothetical protein